MRAGLLLITGLIVSFGLISFRPEPAELKPVIDPVFGAAADSVSSCWKLDESSGNAADAVGGRTLTPTGATYAAAKLNNGGSFDGTNDVFSGGDVLDFERTDAFSFSGWYKLTSAGTSRFVVGKYNGAIDNGWMLFRTLGNKFQFFLANATNNWIVVSTNNTFTSTTNFYHVVVTYSGSSAGSGVKIYVDGTEQAVTVNNDTLSLSTITAVNFTLGETSDGLLDYVGLIDDVSVWARVLTSTEVSEIYNSGTGLACPFAAATVLNSSYFITFE